jgi:hypothetical protein
MPRRDDELTRLLAEGYTLDDLTWIPAGSGVSLELVYLKGQDEAVEMRKALDRAQEGQWVIKSSAVERLIRAMPGCENYSIADQKLPSFTARAYGSRGPR